MKEKSDCNLAAKIMTFAEDNVNNAIVALTPGGIENQEAEGQKTLVNNDTLPREMMRHGDYHPQPILESFGVKFLGNVKGDELFQHVELPEGWKKEPTEHSMWSKLVDDKGRERAAIFYKAAFYDLKAHVTLTPRFAVRTDYDRYDKGEFVSLVTDCEETIYTTPLIDFDDLVESYQRSMQQDSIAQEWLNTNYPDWKNPGAYWD